jgi:autotransporter-associated beta strand protein
MMPREFSPSLAALTVALIFLCSLPLCAATLVNDPFTDGNRSNATGGDIQGAVWYQSINTSSIVSVVDDSAGIGTGNALQMVPTSDFYRMLAFFPSTTLAGAGDTLKVTFDYRFTVVPDNLGGGFRIGLCNSAGTKQTADGSPSTTGQTRNDDKNYGFDTNAGAAASNGTGVRYEDAGDDILGGSSPGTRNAFGGTGASVASGTTKHTGTLQLTRLPNGDLYVLGQVDNLAAATGTHAAASVLTYTFDEFAFGFGPTHPSLLVDNVSIASSILSVLNIAATTPTATRLAPGVFTVTRSSSSGTLAVPYTLSGTATNGVDYTTLSGVVNFANGQSSATITVSPQSETFIENPETVIVTLSQPAGTLLQTSSATVTISETLAAASGQIEPEFSELYTFYITANAGARFWIDDRLLTERTFMQNGEMRGQVQLTAGQRVNWRLESLETMASGNVTLEWASPSRARQVIPAAKMYPNRVDKAGGSILKEYWSGIPGTAISTLTSDPNYPSKPSGRELITSFECLAQDWADNYGTRVTGFIVPPATGIYTFAVSGDETVELYLSTDSTPGNKSLIANVSSATAFRQWNAQSSQQSAGIALVQGQRYYVELLHKENTGSDHFSVGWKKPGDSTFAVIPGSALVQAGLDRTQPLQANLLDTLARDHPRIMATPERFAWLRAMWQSTTPSAPKTWAQTAITTSNTILGQPPVSYNLNATGDLLDQARTAKDRMYNLAVAWWVTGNNQYADRAWTELNTLADNTAFPDWHPAHFLDVAEFTNGCAIGYDWFYNYWTQAQRDTIRNAILNKGLAAGLTQYTTNVSWQRTTGNNWNQVCNGGLSLGALAVGTESEATVEDILNRALNSLRPVMSHYTTDDGAWYEGPGYWTYSTEYLVRCLAGLESSLGSDFGISGVRMFSESGFYPLAMMGPSGQSFNHSDSGANRISEDALQWEARRFNQPLFAWYENTYGSGALDALLWTDAPTSVAASGLTPDMAFHGENGTAYKPVELVTMRTNWSDTRATYLGCKGGWMGADHGNFDGGSFVLDALGKRWFQDLGGDDYALSGYFNGTPNPGGDDRWDYYRNRAEGQNTILVDPGSGPDMIYNTIVPLLAYQSEPTGQRSMAIFDLTPSTSGVTRLWRGFQLLANRRQMLVQDEITAASGAHTVWWFAHYAYPSTSVAIDPDGTSATLTQGVERLWVKIVSGGGTFQIMDAVPLPTSPNPAGQNANTGFKKLAINLNTTTTNTTTLAVWMVPLSTGENPPAMLPTITPLNTWNLSSLNDAPVTPNATATTIGDQQVDIDLRNYATDDSNYPNALGFSVGGAVNGTVILLGDGHTARFTPSAGYVGTASFNFTATDQGGLSSTGTITVVAASTTQVWTAASNGSWSGGANWSSGVPPVSSRGNTIEFFTGQTLSGGSITANNDLGPLQVNVLSLNGTSSAATSAVITGGALTLANNGAANPVVNLGATNGSGLSYDVNTAMTLASPVVFQGNGTATIRFNGDISGAGSLTKTGSGTLILAGNNSYQGGTTLSNGTLQIGNNSTTGLLPAGPVTTNGTLRFHRSDTALNVSNTISGTGSVQLGVSSGGTLTAITTLSGANTFTGNVQLNSGGLRITNSSALGQGTKTFTLANGTAGNVHLRLDGSAGAIDLPATISLVTSNDSVVANGTILNEAGNNIIRGNVTLTSGGGSTRLLVASGTLTMMGNFAPNTTSRTLILGGAGTGAITGSIADGSTTNVLTSLVKADAGTWTLSGPINHTGNVTVSTGTLMINAAVSGPSGVTVSTGATLGGSGSITPNTTISGNHQPGAGIGVQAFSGALSYGSASHLKWELAANADTGAGTNFDQVNAGSVSVTTNAVIDVVLNSAGSVVSFADPFWAQSRTWSVLTSSAQTGSFKLGTVSNDSVGQVVSGFGAFSVQNSATGATLVWTPAAPFQQWQATWFGANWNNASVAGDAVDGDGDGLSNLLEYTLVGGNPLVAANNIAPVVFPAADGRLAIAFDRVLHTGITLTVQAADSLSGPWESAATSANGGAFSAIGTYQVTETGTGANRHVEVHDRYLLTDPAHSHRFLRLRVTRP